MLASAYRTLLGIVFCCLYLGLWAGETDVQPPVNTNPTIDSLLAILPKSAPDTHKVLMYKELCWQYRNLDMLSAVKYGKRGIALAKKLNYKKGEAEICRFIGLTYRHYFLFSESLSWYFKALNLSTQINDVVGIGFCYDNLGLGGKKQYSSALDYIQEALFIRRKINASPEQISNTLGDVATVQIALKKYSAAQITLKEGIQLVQKMNKPVIVSAHRLT